MEGACRCGSTQRRAAPHAAAPPRAQDILHEALRCGVVLIVLERLYLTRSVYWMEEHLDYLCLQSTIFGNAALGFTHQIGVFWQNTRRLA